MGLFPTRLNLAHAPTLFLIIGYPVYWIELYFFQQQGGGTTVLAWVLLITVLIVAGIKQKIDIQFIGKCWGELTGFNKSLFSVGAIAVVIMLAQGFYAATFPIHLTQEVDALNYHVTLPRQHLILHSFKHLPWSSMDLFLLPLDFALAPFWLSTALPNKLPQFFFLLGLVAVVMRLTYRLSNQSKTAAFLSIFVVLSFHSVGIQIGLAMMDIVVAYLFFAAIDSLLRGQYLLALIEASFYCWSKPLIPLQTLVIGVTLILLFYFFRSRGIKVISLGFSDQAISNTNVNIRQHWRRIIIYGGLLSMFIAGPFLIKSLYYAQTPVFPLGVGTVVVPGFNDAINQHRLDSFRQSATLCLSLKDGYGMGQTVEAFLKHLWLIAVPQWGVNNCYDYPVGLIYLLLLVPFIYFLVVTVKKGFYPIIPLMVVLFWGTWWFGSQQTRFLLIPLLLMAIVVIAAIKKPSKVFISCTIIALMLTTVSVLRAHQPDWGKLPLEVLRPKDKELLKLNQEQGKNQRDLDFIDAAYATFPIRIIKQDAYHVLDTSL